MNPFRISARHPLRAELHWATSLDGEFRVAAEPRVYRDPRTRAIAKRRWYS